MDVAIETVQQWMQVARLGLAIEGGNLLVVSVVHGRHLPGIELAPYEPNEKQADRNSYLFRPARFVSVQNFPSN